MIALIAAVSRNMALGYKNELIYHIKNDMIRFRKLTVGHTVIMGLNTYKSLPNGALPYRRNIVLSHSIKNIEGCEVFSSLKEALRTSKNEDVFIIGGASVYKESIEYADMIYLTEIDDIPENADVFFPDIPDSFDVEYGEFHSKDENNPYDYSYNIYKRIKKK